jgi:outer membrane lipoprotein SlyB
MRSLQTILCISLLTLTLSSTAFAGTIRGSSPGTITGSSPGTITGSSPGTITGSSPGTITGSSPGTITGSSPGTITGSKAEPQVLFDFWLFLLTVGW